MGNALRHVGRFDESTDCYRKALEQKPQYADAYNNYGIALSEMGRFDEAVASYTKCLELRPTHVDAHMNRALAWLRKGDYAQAWAEYEWRWNKRTLTNRPMIQPQWNGFPLEGRTIMLITEQRNGDVMQFIRSAPILKAQGGRVIFECPGKGIVPNHQDSGQVQVDTPVTLPSIVRAFSRFRRRNLALCRVMCQVARWRFGTTSRIAAWFKAG
jgi:hypothetical protein